VASHGLGGCTHTGACACVYVCVCREVCLIVLYTDNKNKLSDQTMDSLPPIVVTVTQHTRMSFAVKPLNQASNTATLSCLQVNDKSYRDMLFVYVAVESACCRITG